MTETPKKSERYVQVRDLLEQAARFHGDLAGFYHRLAGEAGQERVKLLLDYMSTHETNLKDSLDVFDEEASEGVLNTWIDRDYCDRIVHACENMPQPPALDVENVIHLAMTVDDSLIRFYEELERKTDVESVREVFRNLVSMEQTELRRLALNALTAQDF
jgi:rubrerythrin